MTTTVIELRKLDDALTTLFSSPKFHAMKHERLFKRVVRALWLSHTATSQRTLNELLSENLESSQPSRTIHGSSHA
eukprot:2411251-Amphidinium_carterae.1